MGKKPYRPPAPEKGKAVTLVEASHEAKIAVVRLEALQRSKAIVAVGANQHGDLLFNRAQVLQQVRFVGDW